tara:strand:- start:195 stop:341 length:147 start_codon:yes stop_codon:yes gene_type:complete
MGDDPHAAGENIPQQKLKGMKKRRLEKRIREKMERVMGFEPTTITLAT